MRKYFVLLLLPLVMLLCSWGGDGHNTISYRSSYFMPQSLLNVLDWSDSLAFHASDADDRKYWDPDESPKHYIDIDDYPMFVTQGRIYQTYDSIIQCFGYSYVESKGLLPWATEAAYDSMKNNFIKRNWRKVVYYASDLGHYVADGYMPLHLTRNFDGQYSGQSGIHSRIESSLVYRFLPQIIYSGDSIHQVADVNKYIFNYIYANYPYVDSLLDDDLYAYQHTGSHNSSLYYNTLWSRSGSKIIHLFRNASKSLAELIYTAWTEAGYPAVSVRDYVKNTSGQNWNIYPNPSNGIVKINYDVDTPGLRIRISVFDQTGHLIKVIDGNSVDHCLSWDTGKLPSGKYLCRMEMNSIISYRKFVLAK